MATDLSDADIAAHWSLSLAGAEAIPQPAFSLSADDSGVGGTAAGAGGIAGGDGSVHLGWTFHRAGTKLSSFSPRREIQKILLRFPRLVHANLLLTNELTWPSPQSWHPPTVRLGHHILCGRG